MAAWPGTLPDLVLRDGYQEGFQDRVTRSSMDTGPAKRRARFTAAPSVSTQVVQLTSAELDIFLTFFNTTLSGGALSFTKTHPRTGATETFAFTKAPDPATPTGYDTYIVQLPLEQLP